MYADQVSNITALQTTIPHDATPREVAKQFESLFVSMMLRSMRSTVGEEDGLIPKNMGEKIYTGMLDDQYARSIVDNAHLGLADLIVKEIERSGGSGVDALRGLRARTDAWSGAGQRGAGAQSLLDGASKWSSLVAEASKRYGVDENLVTSVIAQESGGNQYAISPAGAKGLMQLIDTTAADMGVARVFDPAENIMGGTRYLRMLLDRFKGDEDLALASYNAGPSAVEKYQGIPPYRETQDYVGSVKRLRETLVNRPAD